MRDEELTILGGRFAREERGSDFRRRISPGQEPQEAVRVEPSVVFRAKERPGGSLDGVPQCGTGTGSCNAPGATHDVPPAWPRQKKSPG